MRQPVQLVSQEGPTSIHISASIDAEGNLKLSGHDLSPLTSAIWGDSDYAYWLTVSAASKDDALLALLEITYKDNPSVVTEFQSALKECGISCESTSYG